MRSRGRAASGEPLSFAVVSDQRSSVVSLDTLAIAAVFAVLGFFAGKLSSAKSAKPVTRYHDQKAAAYKELFDAFTIADSALLNAATEERLNGQLPEDFNKQSLWDSLNSIGLVYARVKFLLPQEVVDVLEGRPFGHLGMSWSERLDELRHAKETIYELARKDVGLG
jgi:hypothetical protein